MSDGKTKPTLYLKIWKQRGTQFQALQHHCSKQSQNSQPPPLCHFGYFSLSATLGQYMVLVP